MEYLQPLNEWVPVPGWEKTHLIFSDGIRTYIKRLRTISKKGRVLEQRILNTYVQRYVNIVMDDGIRTKIMRFHRLIGFTYLPNPNNYDQINHIDADKLNYQLNNLEWCSKKQNTEHAMANKLYLEGDRHPNSVLTKDLVNEIREYAKNNPHMSQAHIGKVFNHKQYMISRILRRDTYKNA